MAAPKTRWGILGTGRIAGVLAEAIRQSDYCELAAVGSRDGARAAAFAAEQGAARSYGSYDELLADAEVQFVYNSLPNSLHHEWTIKAAEAGKHILCEKPLAVTIAEAEAMFAAAEAGGVLLMEAFMYRCHPQTARLRALVADGEIGELRLIHSTFSFSVTDAANIRLSAPLAGGGLMDVGCYCLNFSRTMAGAEPASAFAVARFGQDTGVDEHLAGTLAFPGGAIAQFDVGVKSAGRACAEIVGSEGRILVPNPWKPAEQSVITIEGKHPRELQFDAKSSYVLEVDHFAQCVTAGAQPEVSKADSIANTAAICAVLQSAREGRPVAL